MNLWKVRSSKQPDSPQPSLCGVGDRSGGDSEKLRSIYLPMLLRGNFEKQSRPVGWIG